jgi:hypothetical protein
MREALTLYAVGVLVGVWRTDGSPAAKVALALLWPVGPLAFLVTISGLLLAAVIAFVGPRRRA